ncbi:hypothetical protein [Cupriavidus sp. BIC8F]|uniref:hypothetical protein n=1 Tax=Cupriavidus sp. BIC8F TaxID=3079014 RepID=UPI002916DAD9|nr:hypothetical protein [Cupriavidus sp. BIC8F]
MQAKESRTDVGLINSKKNKDLAKNEIRSTIADRLPSRCIVCRTMGLGWDVEEKQHIRKKIRILLPGDPSTHLRSPMKIEVKVTQVPAFSAPQ